MKTTTKQQSLSENCCWNHTQEKYIFLKQYPLETAIEAEFSDLAQFHVLKSTSIIVSIASIYMLERNDRFQMWTTTFQFDSP